MFKRPAADAPAASRLDTAIAARDAKRAEIAEARETLERLQAVADQADADARAAAVAQRKASEFRREWARSGCKYSDSRELQRLEDQAAEAGKAAERSAVNADAVRKELARAEDDVRSAQLELQGCERRIAAERGAQLVAAEHAQSLIEDAVEGAERGRRRRFDLMALLRLFRPGQYEDQSFASPEAARQVEDALERAEIKDWDQERDAARSRDFVEAAQGVAGARGRDEAAFKQAVDRWRERAQQ